MGGGGIIDEEVQLAGSLPRAKGWLGCGVTVSLRWAASKSEAAIVGKYSNLLQWRTRLSTVIVYKQALPGLIYILCVE